MCVGSRVIHKLLTNHLLTYFIMTVDGKKDWSNRSSQVISRSGTGPPLDPHPL